MQNTKPFLKWAGGKGKLIKGLSDYIPEGFIRSKKVTYMEPFVGGGAMLFYILNNYKNIKRTVINDINIDLTGCYKVIRDKAGELIKFLAEVEKEYNFLVEEEEQKAYFLDKRDIFNKKGLGEVENSGIFIFLNKTCFNGLYRVNKTGEFNVPFGKMKSPLICDSKTILADSEVLQRVEILTGDFEKVENEIDGDTFVYLDPPYRPISETSNFNNYTKEDFDDEAQRRLKCFCDRLNERGVRFLLSNSDSAFFDNLFEEYKVEKILASRSINSDGTKRGKLKEIIVRNYVENNKLCLEFPE